MLAGYLPFDDDPANPEGDNINLLYKYIVNTPLTFPEYVTPHARDLLRRILVPNPRKRADLFEVARHSWLSEYAHVVEFITSSTTTPGEIQNTTVPAEEEGSMVARSASVRDAPKKNNANSAIGGLTSKQGTVDPDTEPAAHSRQQRDNKRRTVQVEYVAPNTQTQRGESATAHGTSSKSRARSGSQGPVEVQPPATDKPLPRDPPVTRDSYAPVSSRRPPSAHLNNQNLPPSRASRETARSTSDGNHMTSGAGATGRPTTGGSATSKGYGSGRATYAQPSAPTVASTNVHGSIQQPAGRPTYQDASATQKQGTDYGRTNLSVPSKFSRVSGYSGDTDSNDSKGHRRSNTIGEIGGKIFGRSGSLFGSKHRKSQLPSGEKSKKYPPVSMTQPISDDAGGVRPSMDSKRSRRSFSLGLGKKRSGSITGSQSSLDKQQNRRFTLLPNSFSLKAIGLGKDYGTEPPDSQPSLPMQEPPQMDEYGRYVDQSQPQETAEHDGMYTQMPGSQQSQYQAPSQNQQQQYTSNPYQQQRPPTSVPTHMQQQGSALNSASDSSVDNAQRPTNQSGSSVDQQQSQDTKKSSGRGPRGLLQKNKRFVDAYDTDEYSSRSGHDHAGSSGAARRVMDFFRRRGKARGGEDR